MAQDNGIIEPRLTPKQQRFVDEYLCDLNATQAAIRAGYSEKNADVIGYQLLRKTSVSAEIVRCRKQITEKCQVTQERVIAELACIAFFDPRKLYDENGNLKPIQELDEETATAIQSMDQNIVKIKRENGKNRNETVLVDKIRLHNKIDALDRLARYLGLYEKENQQREITINLINKYDEKSA